MLGVTVFGLLLAPVFYVALRKLAIRLGRGGEASREATAPAE